MDGDVIMLWLFLHNMAKCMWTPEHVQQPSSQLFWFQSVHQMWNQMQGFEQHSIREVEQVLVIRCSGV